MAKLRFEIKGEPNDVAFASYLGASYGLLAVLRELDKAITGKYAGTLRWYVAGLQSNHGLTVDLVSRLKPPTKLQERRKELPTDQSPRVTDSLVTGFDNLERLGVSPPYLSEDGLRRMDSMFNVLHTNGARGYTATDVDAGRVIDVSAKAAKAVRELLPVSRKYLGSVEGRLETISIHNRQRFIIYHARTKKAVTCHFDDPDMIPNVAGMLGQRVLASGQIDSNIKGEPARLRVEDIRVLGARELPTTSDLSGSHPNITDWMSTDDYIRSIRE
jgi:hypothetical protein